jgi:ribonuclease Y
MAIDPIGEAVLVTAATRSPARRERARDPQNLQAARSSSLANDFKGVAKAYAIQAGRELRVVVEAERITDEEAIWLARDVARKVEAELTYPGQIKVTVIRETRAVEYAR